MKKARSGTTTRFAFTGTLLAVALAPVGFGQGCSVGSAPPLATALAIAKHDAAVSSMLSATKNALSADKEGFVSEGFRATQRGQFRGLATKLPARASDARLFGPGFVTNLRFECRVEGARGSAGTLDDGRVVYANVFEDTDEIVTSRDTLFESFFLLRSPSAPRTFSFHVSLPSAVHSVEVRGDGVWFWDARHEFVLHTPAPYALDRNGTKVDAKLAWSDASQTLEVSLQGAEALAYPLLLDPAFETNAWRESKAPTELESPLLAFDVARRNAVLVTGEETWTWNGSTWSDHPFSRGKSFPPARSGGSMVFDPVRQNTVLFGGSSFGQLTAETWLWDGSAWRIAVTPATPSPRSAAAMTFDAARNEVVLFGGVAANGLPLDQTWVWNGQTWSQKNTVGAPSPRLHAALSYDAKQQEVLLFGGIDENHNLLADTWAWNGSTWRTIAVPTRPEGRFRAAMAFDEVRRETVLFGGSTDFVPAASLGDTWTWDGQSWTRKTVALAPPPVGDGRLVFDSARGRVILVGGASGARDGREAGTWSWDGQSWRQDASFELPPRYKEGTLLVANDARKELLLYSTTTTEYPAWAWTGSAFERRSYRAAPAPRLGHALALDPTDREPLLFGGLTEGSFLGDTWYYNRNGWKSFDGGATPPPARAYHRLAFDPSGFRVVMFGGLGENGYLQDTWTWQASSWTKRNSPISPSPRSHYGMAATRTGTVILFGGRNASGPLNDTWEWNGQSWAERFPATTPDPDGGTLMVEDVNGATLLRQGQTFRWTGVNWEHAQAPGLHYGALASAAYHADTQEIFVVTDDTTWRGRHGEPFRQVPEGAQPVAQPTDPIGAELVSAPYGLLRLSPTRDATFAENVFALSNSRWVPFPTAAEVYPVGSARMAFDAKRGNAVLIDRDDLANTSRTWTWNGTSVQRPAGQEPSPPVRYFTSMTFDVAHEEVVLFGGMSPNGGVAMGDTWTWDGTTWRERRPPNNAPPRMAAVMAYDAAHGYVLMFGGKGDGAVLQDTWTWDGTTWQERSPKTLPAPRESHAMSYSPELGSVVLFGGNGEGAPLSDTWRWDGADWVPISTTAKPAPRGFAGFASHASTKRLVLYGGVGDNLNRKVLRNPWFFYARGGACTTGADCAMGSCVDGVCCDTNSCGTCETCAGTDPGKCTPILNGEDPDSCALANRVSCNELAQCRPTVGAECKTATDCASGFCADGICCDSACDRPCESCKAKEKSSGKGDGTCGPAMAGTNPAGRCSGEATCNQAAVCSTDTSASCRDARFFSEPTSGTTRDCAPYKCVGSCLTRCSSANDCVYPATCDPSGKCSTIEGTFDDSGCSTKGSASSSSSAGGALVLLAGVVACAQRRRRRVHA